MASKLIASEEPVSEEVSKVTPGLGFPLLPVDGGEINLETETIIDTASFVTQEPTAVDDPIQVEFGGPVITPDVEVDALGTLKFNTSEDWLVTIRLNFGRSGVPGIASVFARSTVNGVPNPNTVNSMLDDGGFSIPLEFFVNFSSVAGDLITLEMYRDSAGINEGGLFAATASLAGWGDSPSARIIIKRATVRNSSIQTPQAFSL